MKKSNVGRMLFLGTVMLVCFLWGKRYLELNRQYPNPDVQAAKMGETLQIGGYSFTLTNWEWHTGEVLDEIIPGYIAVYDTDGIPYPAEKEKVALASVEITKTQDDSTVLDMTNVAYEMGAWHNGWDLLLYKALNGEDSIRLQLSANEKKTIVFPIIWYAFDFANHEKKWEDLENQEIDIVLAHYPIKYMLCKGGKEQRMKS